MGQYYMIVNLDKREYIHPHKFHDGLKLMEFGLSGYGTMAGLAILLADGNNRGGGDIHSDNPIIGSWSGDRIVVAGDYADPGKFMPPDIPEDVLQRVAKRVFTQGHQKPEEVNLHFLARCEWEDISGEVIDALSEDSEVNRVFKERGAY